MLVAYGASYRGNDVSVWNLIGDSKVPQCSMKDWSTALYSNSVKGGHSTCRTVAGRGGLKTLLSRMARNLAHATALSLAATAYGFEPVECGMEPAQWLGT